jgi:hypothetical protein
MKIQKKRKTHTQTWKKNKKELLKSLFENVILRKNIVNTVMGRSFWQKELERLGRTLPRKRAAKPKFWRREGGRYRAGRSKKDVDQKIFSKESGGYLNDKFVRS